MLPMKKYLHVLWHRTCLHLWIDTLQPARAALDGAQARQILTQVPQLAPLIDRATMGELVLQNADTPSLATQPHQQAGALHQANGEPCSAATVEPHQAANEPRHDTDQPHQAADQPHRTIQTCTFAPADAVDLLLALSSRNGQPLSASVLPENLHFDQTVEYFSRLARFILECIAHQHFYPDLQPNGDGSFHALWRPLIDSSAQIAQLEAYAAAASRICPQIIDESNPTEPAQMVESFLLAGLDALVRRGVADDPFFHRAEQLVKEPFASPDVRWLAALLGSSDALSGSLDDQSLLARRVAPWVGQLDEARSSAAWRLCLTLQEPDPDQEDAWPLTFGLQNGDDPSDIIDAQSLFSDDASGLLGRNVARRRSQLTKLLAAAVELCPPLQRIIGSPTPTHVDLSTTEAHLFIRQWTPSLLAADIHTFLPSWATHTGHQLGLLFNVSPHAESSVDPFTPDAANEAGAGRSQGFDVASGRFGLRSLLDFDWQIALGDVRLSLEEFKSLVASNQPLIKRDGQWFQVDLDAAQAAVRFLENQSHGQMTLGEVLRTSFGTTSSTTGLPVVAVKGTGWLEQFLEQTTAVKLDHFSQPDTFVGTLRPYQLRGLQWLSFLDELGVGACLADDMGLGKTIMLISLLLRERELAAQNGQPVGATLLFAPTSVVGNWMREAQRFGPSLRVMVHHGPDRLTEQAFARQAAQHDLVITSYALAYRDVQTLSMVKWYRIVLDEAQKIKNPNASATVAIRSLSTERCIALTGTPVENHLSELWSIMQMLNPGLLGTTTEFREQFASPIEKSGDSQRAMQLRQLIRPFVLRRTKTDPQVASDLPQKMEMKIFCNLTPEQAGLYEQITSEMLGRIDSAGGIRRRGLILATLTRLKQVCDHPALLEMSRDANAPIPAVRDLMARSGKVERLLDMLEEIIDAGDSALIFTQYRRMGHLLEKILAARLKQPLQFLHGGTPSRNRDQMIERFQRPGSDVRIFLLSLRAGGLGLNLTAANHVFHFDRWWNPAVEAQATDRAYRIGQTRKVQVHKFICAGTMEERIDRLLMDKIALADQIVSSGDEWLTDLSTEQLRDYLSLSRDAVGEYETVGQEQSIES